jgi:hypothetical protein
MKFYLNTLKNKASSKYKIPRNKLIQVNLLTRTLGDGERYDDYNLFRSYESASKFILAQFMEDGMAVSYYDFYDYVSDMDDDDIDDDMEDDYLGEGEGEFPLKEEPTLEWAKNMFSPKALYDHDIEHTPCGYTKLYGPHSNDYSHCPFEIMICLVDIN